MYTYHVVQLKQKKQSLKKRGMFVHSRHFLCHKKIKVQNALCVCVCVFTLLTRTLALFSTASFLLLRPF